MLDPSGVVKTWNSGAERITGYSSDEIVGQHFSRLYDAEASCERALEVATREGRFEEDTWGVRKDGTRCWANMVITPLDAEDAQPVGFAYVAGDLTERRKAEEERIRAAAAEEANRLREDF